MGYLGPVGKLAGPSFSAPTTEPHIMKIKLLRGVLVDGKPTAEGTVLETDNTGWARMLVNRGWAAEASDDDEGESTEGGESPKVIIDTGKADDDETDAKPKGKGKPKGD